MKRTYTLRLAILMAVFATISTVPSAIGQVLSWRVEYDGQGRIARKVDPAGRVTHYAYTPASGGPVRSVTVTPPKGTPVTWRFDNDGQLAAMSDGEGEVVYRYDNHGRLAAVERKGAPAVRCAYDAAGRIAELRVGDFYRIAWTYDFLGNVSSLDTPAGRIRYEYQAGQGVVIRSLPNGVKTFWKRQANGELEEIIHGFFQNPDDRKYTLLAQYNYAHGPDGRITAIRERSGRGEFARDYSYDIMGRLIGATGPGGQVYGYAYDLIGNRVKATATGRPDQTYEYDWAGRLTSVDGNPCAYDAGGNLTDIMLAGVARQYRYHPDGHLAEARVAGKAVQYRYDGFGRLIARKTASGETRFIPDPLSSYWQPLLVEEAGGERTLIIWEGTAPLALVNRGKVEWLLEDHLKSARLRTDAQGKVVQQCDYDSFGVPEQTQKHAMPVPGFAGLFRDGETDVSLALGRAFIAEMGSFLQPDPERRIPTPAAEDSSLYSYCGNDPLNFVDRDSLEKRHYNEPINVFVAGISMREQDAQRVAQRFLGPNAVGIAVDYGRVRAPDILWAAADQTTGGYTTRTEEKLWSRLSQYRDIGTLEVYSHGAIATGNLAKNIDEALTRGSMRINNVVFLGVNADEHLVRVLDKHGIPHSVRAHEYDPVPIVTTPNSELGSNFPILGRIPGVRWILGGAAKVTVAATLLPGVPGPYNTKYHDIDFLHGVGMSPDAIPSRDRYGDLLSGIDPQRLRESRLLNDRFAVPPPLCPPICFGGGGAGVPSPSRVGGVSLSGAGGVVEGLGALKGVRLDANGNILLIGEGGGDVTLPPLRLDDVVTVFRSVYLHGEGPTVTIDPNPENPEKSAMIIRHSQATEGTYVGWILYQADRLMKSYAQGVDNKTEKDVVSRVPGYDDVLKTVYFGADDPRKSQKQGIWERFWIVPAEVRLYEGLRRELTLIDVPLKVKTQKMKWVNDKLEDDLTGTSSPGATAFASWFTANYDGISSEQYLLPPPESGITSPVPVFTELRQIALMTAVAEKLRDRGVPMPFWMHDYEARKVPFEQFTPGMEVTRQRSDGNTIQTARIFGGVQLSADSKAVRTFTTAADVAKAPPEMRAEVDRTFRLAERLEQAAAAKGLPTDSAPLTVRRIVDDNREFRAVSVPGSETVMLGPSRLDEVDLAVPIAGGGAIRLARSYNSFFNPKGPWGRGWTLDLPHLVEIRVPVDREEGKSSFTTGHVLLTPLNSYQSRFLNGRPVLTFANPKAPAEDDNSPFLGVSEDRPAFFKDATTLRLMLKNGREWHFSPHGDLVAVKEGPRITVYERDREGQVTRIVGLLGGRLAGEIRLEYSGNGSLAKAVGTSFEEKQSKPVEVAYSYDNDGRLIGVVSDKGTVGYGYQGSWVNAVTWQDKIGSLQPEVLRSFQYNSQGQVLSEKDGRTSIVHNISLTPEGVTASSRADSGEAREQSTLTAVMEYDDRLRLTKSIAANGARSQWSYPAAGGIEMTVATPDQRSVKVVDSPDGRRRTIEQSGAPPIAAQFDSGGRLTNVSENGRPVLTQEWRPDGQLARAETAVEGASLRYDGQGLLSSIVLHPAKAGEGPAEWQETKLDRHGRPVEVSDYSGMQILMGYDDSGALTSAVQRAPDGKGNYGYNVKRDEQGRIQAVKSSWGETAYSYDKEGNIKSVVATRGSRTASIELSGGQVRALTGFDNGRTAFEYHKDGPFAGMPLSIVCPNGLKLEYEYDTSGNLTAVNVGTDRRVRLEYDSQGRMNTYAWEPIKR